MAQRAGIDLADDLENKITFKGARDTLNNALPTSKTERTYKKVEPSWHNQMVRSANESFRKRQEAKQAPSMRKRVATKR